MASTIPPNGKVRPHSLSSHLTVRLATTPPIQPGSEDCATDFEKDYRARHGLDVIGYYDHRTQQPRYHIRGITRSLTTTEYGQAVADWSRQFHEARARHIRAQHLKNVLGLSPL